MGMFGGAKKKKVPNSRKKKGAVAAKTKEVQSALEKAPEPEQPVAEKPTETPAAAKPVFSVAERAKAFNGGGLKPAVAPASVAAESLDDKPTEAPPAKEPKKSLFGRGKKNKAEATTDNTTDRSDPEPAGDESQSAEEGAPKKELKKSGSKFSLFGKGRGSRKSKTEATDTPAQREAEQPAAEEPSATQNEPEKRKSFGLFGGNNKKKTEEAAEPAKEEPETKKSGPKFGLFGKKKAGGENDDDDDKSHGPAVVPGEVGKLSMNKLALNIPGLGGPRGTNLQEKTAPGMPPPKIDIYAESEQNPDAQGHAGMSEKARQTLVAPKEKNGKEDWKFIYELAKQYDNYKSQEAEATKKNSSKVSENKTKAPAPPPKPAPGDNKAIKNNLNSLFGGGPMGGGGVNMTANGSFLNNKYFDGFLVERSSGVAFEFSNQTGLFRRFTQKAEQRSISQQFAVALLKHPKAKKITQLNMNGALLPDAFLVALCETCAKSNGLPLLQVMNLESNELGREALEALAAIIANPKAWRRLQILKLENQKREISVGAEEVLGDAVVQSPSIVQVGIQMKGGIPKQQIANTVQSNMDKLRVARREHASKKGTLKARKRNEMETLFDTIATNKDKELTEVDLTENLRFLGLDVTERTKTGVAFASNKYVSKVTMTKLKLDDDFAEAFGKALVKNTTLETVVLDSNSFSARGVIALLTGLGQNKSVTSFQIRHQSKTMASSDEEALPDLLKNNTTLVKLGTDVRNPLIKTQLDRKTNNNREIQRKLRVAQKTK